jgi:hypothetical protein
MDLPGEAFTPCHDAFSPCHEPGNNLLKIGGVFLSGESSLLQLWSDDERFIAVERLGGLLLGDERFIAVERLVGFSLLGTVTVDVVAVCETGL